MQRRNPQWHGTVLGFLTLLFFLRVLGQFLVAFFSVNWLPAMEHWYSGLLPYPPLLAIQLVILLVMTRISVNISRDAGYFARKRPAWSRFLTSFSAIYAGAMVLRYALTMIFRPEMRWLGGTIPIFYHFVLAAFLFALGPFSQSPNDICKGARRMIKIGAHQRRADGFSVTCGKGASGSCA
jgi:hypothetical protein